MRHLLALLLLLSCAPAAAQVDPKLVGMWQLQWGGNDMFWQVRADGVYRLIGIGARPAEHWGRIQASANKWSSEWEIGVDGGSYELKGNSWIVTGALGTGTWARIWPAQSGGAICPHIDVAQVENHFGAAIRGRMVGNRCDLSATKVGVTDELTITTEVVDPSNDGLRLKRADCTNGTNKDPGVRCIAGLGDVAFFNNGSLYVYRGNTRIALVVETHPDNASINDADEIALGRVALSKL